jgi:hypothetical protein
MTQQPGTPPAPPAGSKIYIAGNIGAGARFQQGEYLTMIGDTLMGQPGGDVLAEQFTALATKLAEHPDLDPDTRDVSIEKTTAVATGLAQAATEPGKLRRALLEAKAWFGSTASWAWGELTGILKSEAAQKTIGTITEAATKAAIAALIGGA